MADDYKSKRIDNKVRVIYRPRAGRAQTVTAKIDSEGTVSINGGSHTISQDALFHWKGKSPWCIINEGTIPAMVNHGMVVGPSPKWLDEVIRNHYAQDTMGALDHYSKDTKSQLYLILGALGLVLLIEVILGVWTMSKVDGILHFLAQQLASNPTPLHGADTTVVHA